MTTAASRPGGKFGGAPRRGKKLLPSNPTNYNQSSETAASSSSTSAGNPNLSTSNLSNTVTLEMIQKKRAEVKRHEVFDKLDQAEQLVLDVLNIASNTVKGFEFLASPSAKVFANDDISDTTRESKKVEFIEDDLTKKRQKEEQTWKKKIRSNGKLYMSKIQNIHDLLMPHAGLVINYGNTPNDKQRQQPDPQQQEEKSESSKKKNMYTSRLEMRLAIDKKNLMNDMVDLEKKMIEEENKELAALTSSNGPQDTIDTYASADHSLKRKREEEYDSGT